MTVSRWYQEWRPCTGKMVSVYTHKNIKGNIFMLPRSHMTRDFFTYTFAHRLADLKMKFLNFFCQWIVL